MAGAMLVEDSPPALAVAVERPVKLGGICARDHCTETVNLPLSALPSVLPHVS
jgi:hypothetical protein